MNKIRVEYMIPVKLARKVRKEALKKGKDVSEIATEALQFYINKKPQKKDRDAPSFLDNKQRESKDLDEYSTEAEKAQLELIEEYLSQARKTYYAETGKTLTVKWKKKSEHQPGGFFCVGEPKPGGITRSWLGEAVKIIHDIGKIETVKDYFGWD